MGFFSKIKNAFKKTKTAIDNKLLQVFSKGELDDEFFEELEYALVASDIGAVASEEIVTRLRAVSSKQKLRNQEDVKQALREIMVEILEANEQPETTYPLVIMAVGVNGVGKTTSIGKLANYYKQQGKNVLLVAGDTFRAAAAEQLTEWAKRNNVKIVKNNEGSDPASVVFDGISSAKAKGYDVVIVDTAGRLHNKVNLMEELKKVSRVVANQWEEACYQKVLVLDATTGQNAISQVEYFDEAIGIDGLILTKLDGTAKGGVVLAIAQEYNVPVMFIGTGEGLEDIEPFDANNFVEAIV
ncbi:MAG: signal recognition particle-docking protein FtsY [Clostridia bacterium]|nr:signal recognition particle-docking protein FtsY [Clostridia bacterium]MBQ9786499.1 signal recognition particle-docking protein FtsY [Clostridia bacterium]